jgi:hypothetical protein
VAIENNKKIHMKMQEDKYIASQLNSLNSLPEGYQANISSKWEMIEMGMEQRSKRFPFYSLLAAAACLILMIGAGYFYFIGTEQNSNITKVEEKKGTGTIVKQAEQITAPNKPTTATAKVSAKKTIAIKKATVQKIVIPINYSISNTITTVRNIPVEPTIQPTMKQEQASTIDNNNTTASSTAQPTTKKTKQRYFQMDFGEGTANDAAQKTASNKTFQFRFSSKPQVDGIPSSTKTGMPKLVQPL